MMGDRQYLCPVWEFDVYDVIGEPANEDASDIRIGDSGHGRPGARNGFDPGNDPPDRAKEVGPRPDRCPSYQRDASVMSAPAPAPIRTWRFNGS